MLLHVARELLDGHGGVTVAVGVGGDARHAHRPNSFQASVPDCRLWSSLA